MVMAGKGAGAGVGVGVGGKEGEEGLLAEALIPYLPQRNIIKEPIEFVKGLFIFPKNSLDAFALILASLIDFNKQETGEVLVHRGKIEELLEEIEGEGDRRRIKQRSKRLIERVKELKIWVNVRELKKYAEKRKRKGLTEKEVRLLKETERVIESGKEWEEIKVLENIEQDGYGVKGELNKVLEFLARDLKNGFIAYKVKDFLKLKRGYSKILFRKILMVRNYGILRITDKELIELGGKKENGKGFKRKSDIVRKGIIPALKELEEVFGIKTSLKKWKDGKGGGIKEIEIRIEEFPKDLIIFRKTNSKAKSKREEKVEEKGRKEKRIKEEIEIENEEVLRKEGREVKENDSKSGKGKEENKEWEEIKTLIQKALINVGKGKTIKERYVSGLKLVGGESIFSPFAKLVHIIENLRNGENPYIIVNSLMSYELNDKIYSENFLLYQYRDTPTYMKLEKFRKKVNDFIKVQYKKLKNESSKS
jgi:hypothetical protein